MGNRPALIVLGGFAGTGKTTLSRRLSSDLGIPRLGSDTLGRIISQSDAVKDTAVNRYWIAHDLVFGLAEEFLRCSVSAVLDQHMAMAFQWQHFDLIKERCPEALFLPIVLRCPLAICLERIEKRHIADPGHGLAPEAVRAESRHLKRWEFLERLDRPDVHFIDAARPEDEVYADIRQYLAGLLNVVA